MSGLQPLNVAGTDTVIHAQELVRVFRSARRAQGVVGTLRSLFAPEMETKTAVAGVSFSVARGELLALLGPNGAGKSTTIKILTGILTPTSGQATVAGMIPYRDRKRSTPNIGVVFGHRTQLWWDLPARESFRILRDIYGVADDQHRRRLRELDQILTLSSFWDTRVRHLSLGQRVRCDLAAALLHEPSVVFLDEPTIGMDVVVKEQVRELLRQEVDRRGRTVLLTTHDMTEVERLTERVVLINHGRMVLDGTSAEIRAKFGNGWRVHTTIAHRLAAATPLQCPDGLRVLSQNGPAIVFGPASQGGIATAHEAIRRIIENFDVTGIRVEESDLEDAMRAAYLCNEKKAQPR
ncbi:ATP-binding cassette domain-containing protein [Streptomyces sp. NPDC015501]|uniref:ABC transporter ATP-binding protein n=1 Tax=Streptomyces sp. NPDC015501 TaxID=3364959 RepID=UPI00093B40BA|nr:ABC transporter ATP-binding protein [Streptomyces sp. CB02366]TVP35633.1 ABC transporter ATP-binding protein [Streptomyces griseus subsp. griseus]